MKHQTKLYITGAGIVLILIGWALFFHFLPVSELVDRIGIQNTYVAAFLLATIGGFSSFTGTSLYAALIALSHGGVNPLALGVIGGIGLFVSDSIFYLVMVNVRTLIARSTTSWDRLFRRLWKWVYGTPAWTVYFALFVYIAVVPLPNDVLLAVLALSSYSYRQFVWILFIGDVTVALLLTYIGQSFS